MKKIFTILAVLCLFVFNSAGANALSDLKGSDPSGKSQRYVIEKTPWYDPTACPGYTSSSSFSNLTGKVYIIGDSITANKQFVQDKLERDLIAKGFSSAVFNSVSSRSLSEGGSDLNGISVFEKDKNNWKDAGTIIIELGTNGGVNQANIAKIKELIKNNNPNATVYWVNVGANNTNRAAQGSSIIDTDSINSILNDNKDSAYKVIDWNTIAKNNPNYILNDDVDVHPFTDDGGTAYVKTIIDGISVPTNTNAIGGNCECSVTQVGGAGNLNGANNEEKVWNYLTSVGYSPAQAAGILGNMAMESGVNPRRVQGTSSPDGDRDYPPEGGGTGYGLVQWTPGTKILTYAELTGKIPGDLGFQLQLLVGQLKGDPETGLSEKAAGDDLLQQTTPEDAAKSFMIKFERPADQSEAAQERRAARARGYFEEFAGKTNINLAGPCGSSVASGSAAKIVAIAEQEYAGGASEANDGYLKYTGNRRQDWCAWFVSWVLNEAGVPFTEGSPEKWSIPWVPNVYSYFLNKNTFHPARSGYVPKPGDIVIWDYGQKGQINLLDHVSIVTAVDGKQLTTIGGNEADKILKSTFASYDNTDIFGYGTQGAQ